MARVLAIDFGLKRTGLAWTDPLQIIATGIGWVETAQLEGEIKKLLSKEVVERIVLGYPTKSDGSDTDATPGVRQLEARLGQWFPNVPVTRWDERYSSKMALAAMIQAGVPKGKRREKGLHDQVAATILLQEYLQSRP